MARPKAVERPAPRTAAKQSVMDLYKAAFERSKRKFASSESKLYFPKVGRTQVRFLPPMSDGAVFYVEAGTHFLQGVKRIVFCQNLSSHGSCYICEQAALLERQGKDVRDLRPSMKYIANAVVRGGDTNPVQFVFGPKIHKQVLNTICDEGYCDDPASGYDFVIDRTGSGKNDTDYFARPKSPSPLSTDPAQAKAYLAARVDLTTLTKMDEDDLKNIWLRYSEQAVVDGEDY